MAISLYATLLSPAFSAGDKKEQHLKVVLTLADEAITALAQKKLRAFDALIKNEACEVTALQVIELSKKEDLLQEALITQKTIQDQLKNEIIKDITTSAELITVITLFILTKMCAYEVKNGREIPTIVYEKADTSLITKKSFTRLIQSLQSQASFETILFIENKITLLEKQKREEACFLRALVKEKQYSPHSFPICKIPLRCTLLTVLECYKGIMLFKVKTSLGGKKIESASEERVFLKMPEEKVLEESEISESPLMVVEGFLENKGSLKQTLIEKTISLFFRETLQELEEKKTNLQNFKIDHLYASTLIEENVL